MEFKEFYRLGQEKRSLVNAAEKYDAWPKGLTIGGGEGVERMANAIEDMTRAVRVNAATMAESIKTPEGLLSRLAFNLGYFVGSQTSLPNICTSEGPVNPFTGQVLFPRHREYSCG